MGKRQNFDRLSQPTEGTNTAPVSIYYIHPENEFQSNSLGTVTHAMLGDCQSAVFQLEMDGRLDTWCLEIMFTEIIKIGQCFYRSTGTLDAETSVDKAH